MARCTQDKTYSRYYFSGFQPTISPLLYQSFFAITATQISHSRWPLLQTRPALGGFVKRLGLSPQLDPHVNDSYPHILCCDTELRLSDVGLSPSLHSLELTVTPELCEETVDPEFLHLLASNLQATPQLEHLGICAFLFHSRHVQIAMGTRSRPYTSILHNCLTQPLSSLLCVRFLKAGVLTF